MTLGTHAIIGAMTAELVPTHPILGFVLGFASHFLLDSLPHYDYSLSSSVPHKDFHKRDIVVKWKLLADLVPLGLDSYGGLMVSLALFSFSPHSMAIAMLGSLGGVLPDVLQFVYMKTRSRMLLPLQRFHTAIQRRNLFWDKPVPGIAVQFMVILFAGIALRYLKIL